MTALHAEATMPKPKPKTAKQVIACLDRCRENLIRSFRNIIGPDKGKVTNKDAAWDIDCLREGIRLLKAKR